MSDSNWKRQQIFVDMQSMLEDWNQQAEHFFYSGSGDFTDTGEFQIEEYNENGAAIATYTARVIIN